MSRRNYNYIWNTDENIDFEIAQNISPYLEINEEIINYKKGKTIIKVNPYLRFFNIFNCYDEVYKNKKNLESKYIKFFKYIENEILKLLREIDYVNGITVINIYCEKIIKDFEESKYGKKLSENIKKLDEKDKEMLSLLILNGCINLEKEFDSFKLAMLNFFKDSIIYRNKKNNKILIIYIKSLKNEENINKIRIIEKLFLPLDFKMKIYWENHFGVLGVEEVMVLDREGVF